MEFEIFERNNKTIARLQSGHPVIVTVDDALDVIGNAGYLGADAVIVQQGHLTSSFYDLKTKLAGEILQKFSNYRIELAIVGSFAEFDSQSLKDFIRESNKTGKVLFVKDEKEAFERFSGKKD